MDLITFGLLLAAALLIAANLFALYWFGGMLIPIFAGGGPYVPTRMEIVNRMIHVANLTPNDVVVDLGSGDGRLVIAAMHAGAQGAMKFILASQNFLTTIFAAQDSKAARSC
jgi:phospholipid N-methyltransferase